MVALFGLGGAKQIIPKYEISILYTLFNSSSDAVNELQKHGYILVGKPWFILYWSDLPDNILEYCVKYDGKRT